jgi:hypothetical protein
MKAKAPIFACLAVAALAGWAYLRRQEEKRAAQANDQAVSTTLPAAGPPGLPDRASIALGSAIAELERHETISARLRFRVDVMGERLTGSGNYLQGPWQYRLLRLEANVQAGDQLCGLQQVCDGQRLWTRRQVFDNPQLSYIEIAPVLAALAKAPAADATTLTSDLGLGGLPRLLRSLERSFDFTGVEEGMRGTLPMLLLRGQWKPEMLARLLPDQAQAIQAGQAANVTLLPAQVPDQVALYLGRDDLFPYCVEYLRTERAIPQGREAQFVGQARPLLVLELFEVRLNPTLDSLQFVFNPGDLKARDATDDYLKALRQAGGP